MVKKEETKVAKKTATKKNTTKKSNVKKTVTKPKEEVKVIIKEETKKEERQNKLKAIGAKLDKVFNNPKPIIICLCLLVAVLILAFANFKSKYKILVGEVNTEDINIRLVQIDMNPKVNTIYATTATYLKEDAKVYQYSIGYYYEVNGNLRPFFGEENNVESPKSLKELIAANSNINLIEFAKNETKFTPTAKQNIAKLHFVVKASTTEDKNDGYDINIDCPINFVNLSE